MKQIFGLQHYVVSERGEIVQHYVSTVVFTSLERALIEIKSICDCFDGHIYDGGRSVSYFIDDTKHLDSIIYLSLI